nr:uncharacterized protein LOC111955542 [Salvelinus alpinus]
MLPYRLACQDCGGKFDTIGSFKQHVRRKQHQQQVAELFQTDEYKGQVYFAAISVLEHLARKPTNTQYPIIGMCLVTLCVCPEGRDTFYLCHSCEEKCGPGQIIDHLLSADHLSNYYSYTDPDVLSFSWMPNMDMLNLIRPLAVKEMDKNGPGVLRVLDMPKSVFVKLKRSGYSKVMQALTQTDRLAECIRADRPERMTIQEYHRDPNRKHPLLGLQHLVEYCCEGHGQRRSYLCQLCRLPVPSRRVIQHTLSFDHLYWYFKVCHPSTLLMKDCYKEYSCRFISMILDLANQAQDISQSANKEIQQVVLEPAVFSSVEFSVYTEALRKLQTIRRDHEGSLKTSITPGDKLVPFSEGSKITKDVTMTTVAEAVPMETKSSPEKTYVTPTAIETVATASTAPVVTTATSQRGTCRLHCQDCNVVCESVSQYKLHVRHWEHKKMLGDIFGPGDEDSKACIPSFTLYEYLRNPERTEPIIGVYLLVMCVSTECWKMPFYLCHTCQEIIPANLVMTHLTSTLHLRSTLMYQSPQCLPFGWGTEMGLEVLKTLAWEEERVRGERENVLKVFDIPDSVFHSIKMSSYSSAMKRLKNFHRYLKVDRPLTFSAHLKNKDRRIPLLGLQFLVQYSVTRAGASSPGWGFLCLLCERKLSDGLSIAHIHSYEHVTTFLERAHPGSVKEVEESDERRSEILLDLAQQAEKIHAMGRLQFMMLQRYIRESVSYERALVILKAIKKRLNMGELMPLLPPGKKLVPTSSIRDQSQTTPEPAPASVGEEKQTRKETDNETEMDREDTPETIQMTQETGVEVDKRIGKETCSDPSKGTGSDPSKGTGSDPSKGTGSDPSKGTGRETSKDTGRETSKDTGRETSKDTGRETSKDTGRGTITKASQETRKDSRSRGKDEAEKIIKEKEMERNVEKETDKKETSTETVKKLGSKTRNMTVHETSKETGKTTSTETVKETERETCRAVSIVASRASNRETKRKHAKKPETCKTPEKKTYTQTVKEKTKVTPPPISPPTTDLWDFLKKPNREAVIGLSALIECHSHGQPPLYLCQVCGCKVFQNCIVVHVTTDCHRLSYLRSLKTVIVPKGNQLHRKLRRAALKLEKTMGYGEAEVMELDAHTYNFVCRKILSPWSALTPPPQVSEVSNPTMTSTALLSLPECLHQDTACHRVIIRVAQTDSEVYFLWPLLFSQKLVYPELAADWPVSPELTVKAGPLHEELRVRAAELEAQEGLGQPTVVKREPVAGDTTTTNTEGTAQQSQNSSPPLTVKEEPVDSTVPSQPPRGEKRNKRRSNPVVGVNFLVQVSDRRRKQYYCQLCSVRMKHAIADHMTSLSHRHNYVRLKYPGWTSSPVEMEKKLFKMAVHLEKVDRDAGMGMQKVEVEADEYKELLSFPVEEAVSKLQAIIRRQQEPCDLRHTAPSTNHNPEDLRQTAPLSNSDAAQGPAQGLCGAESRETEGVCPLPVSLSEEENDQTPQRLLVQISVFLGEDQEPLQVPSPFLQDQPSLTSIPLPLSTPPPIPLSSSIPPSLSPSIPLSTSLSTVVLSTSPSLSSSIPSHTPSLSTENTTHPSPVSVPVPAPLSALRSSTHLKDWETSLSPEWWERKSPECRETQMLLEIPDRHTLLEYSDRDRQAHLEYSERVRRTDYSERDRQADYSERDRQADYSRARQTRRTTPSETDRRTTPSETDRRTTPSARQTGGLLRARQTGGLLRARQTRRTTPSETDRRTTPSETDRRTYSERDRQADYSGRDRQADYSGRDRQADYSGRDRQADYSGRDRQAAYSGRQADYSERDRQADYSERDRQADYSERDRQADYSERDRQADYLRGNRQTDYLASQSLHQTTEHWVTGQVTSMDTMLYSTPTEPDEDQEHTHHHSEHTHQHGEHAHFEQAPASWLSVPQVYLLPDTPAAKRVVGPSHLSKYLKVKGLHNTEPIIGLGSVVECRGISQATFFICVSCAETLSSTHICEHIISAQHQQCYMFSQYSPMRCDWLREQQQPPSPQLLRKVASALSQLEVDLDAQVMLLDQMWYNLVQSAPFYEAMNMLQEQNQNALCLHTASRHQLCPPVGPDPATEQGFDQNHRVMDKLTMDQIEPHHPLQTADTVAGKLTGDQLESGQCIQTADRRPDNQNPDQPQLSQSSERTEPIRDQTPQNHNSEPIRDQTPQNIEPIRAQMPKNSDPIKSQTPQNTEPKRAWMPQNSSEPHLDQDNTVIIKQEPVDPKMEPQTHPQTQPEVDPLKDSLYGHRVQFSPDVQNLAGVCEVEYQGTVLGHSQEVTRIGGATENSLHSTKNLRDSVNNSLPLVGLSAVIECCSEGQVSFYLCVSCGSKIEKTLLISHVLKYRHRQIYLTMRYPWYFLGVVPARGLAEQSRLMQIAKEVEEQNHDEPGTLQEVILAPADFDEIKRMLFDKAVSRLQEICREQNQTELLTMVTSKPEPIVVKQEIVECQVVSHQALGQFLPTQRCRRNTGKRCSNVEGSEVRGQQQVKKRKVSSPPEGHTAPVICLSSPEVTKSSDTHTVNQTHTITPSPTQSNTKPKLTPSCTHSDSQNKLKPSRTHPKPNSTAPEYTRPKLIPHSATKPSGIPADSLTVAKESSSKKPTHTLCKPTHTLSNPTKTLFTSSQKLTDKHSDKNESQKHTEKAKPTRTQSERTHRNRTHTRKHSDLTCTDKAKDRHSDRTKRRHSDRKHTNRHSDHSRSHTLSKRHNRSSSRSSKASPIASPSEPPLLSPYSPAAFSPTRATSAASLSQVKPSQPSCLLNKQLPKQSSQPTKRPPNPTSAVRPLQTQANPPNNTSYPHLHPARTGPRTPPPGPMTPQPPAIPSCLTPPPQPDPVYASGVKKKTSIVDCDQFVEYFVSLLRSPHFPPALTTPERAESAQAHTRATGPNPGGEEMRGDSNGHAIAIVAALPNLLKRKLSLQKPEDRDPWNYESRQFTPNSKPNPNFQNPNSKPNPNFQNPNSNPNPNFQNPNSNPNPNFQNPNSKPNPNFQNPNSKPNPNFQNPNSNPDFQNPNPNFQNPNSYPNLQNP